MSTRRKPPTKLAPPVVRQSAKLPLKTRIDESKTLVSAGGSTGVQAIPTYETVEISSDSSEDDFSDEEADEDPPESRNREGSVTQIPTTSRPPTTSIEPGKQVNGAASEIEPHASLAHAKRPATDDPSASDSEPQSPTFGELARSRIVDVQAQLNQQQQQPQQGTPLSLPQSGPGSHSQVLAPPSLSSLGTVLTQALQSDDTELLESCLQTTDLAVVRATIQRLDSALAASLLQRLASRMHRRPGRASTLLSWVQWTLIAHGGALAAQPDLQRRLADLNRVLEERARGLNSLLVLKGKLDMLEAQMQLRRASSRSGRTANGTAGAGYSGEEEPDDAAVVYVEGEEDGVSGEVDASMADDDLDMSAINGVDSDSEDDEADDEESDEAEEYQRALAGEESVDDEDVDFDDVDESGEEDSDMDTAAPPAKVQKTSSTFPKRK